MTSQNEEREILLESEVQVCTLSSALGSQNLQSDSVVSFTASGETHIEGDKLNPKLKHSPSYGDNKGSYSSLVCPISNCCFLFLIFSFMNLAQINLQSIHIYCSALLVGSPSSFMIGIQQNFLDVFDSKYSKCSLV